MVIPETQRLRQGDLKFKARLGNTVRSLPQRKQKTINRKRNPRPLSTSEAAAERSSGSVLPAFAGSYEAGLETTYPCISVQEVTAIPSSASDPQGLPKLH